MSIRVQASVVLLMLTSPVTAVRAEDRQLLHDPGFEQSATGTLAATGPVDGWEIQYTAREAIRDRLRAECVADAQVARAGERALRLTIPRDTVGFEFVTVGQRVPLSAGREYEASVWVRWREGPDSAPAGAGPTSGHRSAIVSFWARHRDGTGTFAGRDEWLFDNRWRRLTFRFRAIDGEQRTLVYVSLLPNQRPAQTAVLVDDFQLHELEDPVEVETRTDSLTKDAGFQSQPSGPVDPPWYFAHVGGESVRGSVVVDGDARSFRMAMGSDASNYESGQLWQHAMMLEGVPYEVACRMRWETYSPNKPPPIVNFGVYHEESRTWFGPVDQVLDETGGWRTYRFTHIPPHSGTWKLYVQLNGWGNSGERVTVSFDEFTCLPTR